MRALLLPFQPSFHRPDFVHCQRPPPLAGFAMAHSDWPRPCRGPPCCSRGLSLLGIRDLFRHDTRVLRNYRSAAHLRFILESCGGDAAILSKREGRQRSARPARGDLSARKMALDKRPFGTQYDGLSDGYEWRSFDRPNPSPGRRSVQGRPDCAKPYSPRSSTFSMASGR